MMGNHHHVGKGRCSILSSLLLLLTLPVSFAFIIQNNNGGNSLTPRPAPSRKITYEEQQRKHGDSSVRTTHPASATQKTSTASTSTTALAMGRLTLYGHPGSRSPLVDWALYELGVTDFARGDMSVNPHPFGQIPCLTDDDDDGNKVMLFESGAILQYLLGKYTAGNDSITPQQRAAITSWISWANASLDPICFLETPQGKVYDTGLRSANRRIDRLNEILAESAAAAQSSSSSSSFVLVPEAGFTLADVAVGAYLLYVVQFFPDAVEPIQRQWPTVAKYMKACAARPTYGQAFGSQTQDRLVQALS